MGNDEAAIAADIHAGQHVLLGRHMTAGVLKDDVDAAAWRERIRCDREDAMLALQARQQVLSDLAVEILHEDAADRAGDDANAVAADGEPVMQLRGGGALALIGSPRHGWQLLTGAHGDHRPAQRGVEQRPVQRGLRGAGGVRRHRRQPFMIGWWSTHGSPLPPEQREGSR